MKSKSITIITTIGMKIMILKNIIINQAEIKGREVDREIVESIRIKSREAGQETEMGDMIIREGTIKRETRGKGQHQHRLGHLLYCQIDIHKILKINFIKKY